MYQVNHKDMGATSHKGFWWNGTSTDMTSLWCLSYEQVSQIHIVSLQFTLELVCFGIFYQSPVSYWQINLDFSFLRMQFVVFNFYILLCIALRPSFWPALEISPNSNELFHDGCPYHIETSTLICRAFLILVTCVPRNWQGYQRISSLGKTPERSGLIYYKFRNIRIDTALESV